MPSVVFLTQCTGAVIPLLGTRPQNALMRRFPRQRLVEGARCPWGTTDSSAVFRDSVGLLVLGGGTVRASARRSLHPFRSDPSDPLSGLELCSTSGAPGITGRKLSGPWSWLPGVAECLKQSRSDLKSSEGRSMWRWALLRWRQLGGSRTRHRRNLRLWDVGVGRPYVEIRFWGPLAAQQGKDWALSLPWLRFLPWHGFAPWPGKFLQAMRATETKSMYMFPLMALPPLPLHSRPALRWIPSRAPIWLSRTGACGPNMTSCLF